METEGWRPLVGGKRRALKPSFEGWKLKNWVQEDALMMALKPSFEGWKLRVKPKTSPEFCSLKPSFEGWKLGQEKRRGNVIPL